MPRSARAMQRWVEETKAMAQAERDKIVHHLNALLRTEISAVETYRQALTTVHTPTALNGLAECERSHERRVTKLKARILELGGKPTESSGVWGTLAKLVQGGADALGDRMAIAALEEEEDRGVHEYKRAMVDLDPESRDLLEQELIPAQMRTHRAMSSLKEAMH